MKLYVISYAITVGESIGSSCVGIFEDYNKACNQMESCRDAFIADMLNNVEELEGQEGKEVFQKTIKNTGSIKDNYFEINWFYDDRPTSIYIRLDERSII